MLVGNVSMPHPVLGILDDIREGAFNVSFMITTDKEERKYVIPEIKIEITNSYIKKLYDEKKLNLILKISCTPTYKTWTFINPIDVRLPENEIDLLLEVDSFLIAADQIQDYFDSSFSDIFDNKHFLLESGDIVGVTGSKRIVIPKENEKVSLGSIFRFSKIMPDSKDQELNFEFDEDQIVINYPSNNQNYDPVTLLFDKVQGMPYTALSLYIIPALTEAFRIRMDKKEDIFTEKKWFAVLELLLPDNELEVDPFINAQKTIRTGLPLNLAFDEFIKLKNLQA